MTYAYFDESRHTRAGFSVGAFVCFENDPSAIIRAAIASAGFTPGRDEYKSRHRHDEDSRWTALRDELYRIARAGSIGLTFYGNEPAAEATHAAAGLAHFLSNNEFASPVRAFFDEGVFRSSHHWDDARSSHPALATVLAEPSCDSRVVPGIQVADLVAHTCAVVVLADLGLVSKTVKAGPNSGYDEDLDLPLEFELWAALRWSFPCKLITDPDLQGAAQSGLVDTSGAIYVAGNCPAEVRGAAEARYRQTWRGCIH
jgi:hypothetical protein